MTEQEAIARLKAIWTERGHDPEAAHSLEDELLLDVIRHLGWTDFVASVEAIDGPRWCA